MMIQHEHVDSPLLESGDRLDGGRTAIDSKQHIRL